MFGIGDYQSTAFRYAHDPSTQDVEKLVQLVVVWPAGALKCSFAAAEYVGPVEEQHVQVRIKVEGCTGSAHRNY